MKNVHKAKNVCEIVLNIKVVFDNLQTTKNVGLAKGRLVRHVHNVKVVVENAQIAKIVYNVKTKRVHLL